MNEKQQSHYVSVSTGNKLERRPGMFYWRGVTFHGLMDRWAILLEKYM